MRAKSVNRIRKIIGSIPTIGILIFAGLYFYSSQLYPGGSQADVNAVGFDWVNNYWCNLLNETGMNGQVNPARPFAIFAMIVLCFSLLVFFIKFAKCFSSNLFWRISIQVFGILSMLFSMLIFTKHHDLMTTLSSIAGVVVVVGIIKELYSSQMTYFKWSGLFCIVLLAINNGIYYSQHWIEHLPLIQKITFLFVLSWIIGLNVKMANQSIPQQ